MKKKILVFCTMLVLICTLPLSAIGYDDADEEDTIDVMEYALEHPSPIMTRIVLLYFETLVYSNTEQRVKMLQEVYRI